MTGTSSGRNKLLHRFYEPLVLLFALDRVQGDHLYSDSKWRPLHDTTDKELRRRFLDSLSYICDYQKGGDTITAIGAAASPLSYFVAGNKTPREKVKDFLKSVFSQLEQVYDMDHEERIDMENVLLESCVRFSEQRIRTYWKFLELSMEECSDAVQDDLIVTRIRDMKEKLQNSSKATVDLCRYCYDLMRSPNMDFIKQRVNGNGQSPFRAAKHNIGRIAAHVKNVKVLLAAAERLPQLVLDPQIVLIGSPPSIVLPPPSRAKLQLDGIARRMVPSSQSSLLSELQASLKFLDHRFNVEQTVKKVYLEKKFNARVHAELIVLEYFYERNETLQYLDNDRFIGCSKPACYCCSLYFRMHPANVDPPDTHQKIYLNWLPPTSVSGVENPNSNLAIHEKVMLNGMVQSIRSRAIEQIRNQTGRRQRQFDSTTGETLSTHARAAFTTRQQIVRLQATQDINTEHENDDPTTELIVLMNNVRLSQQDTQSGEDSDDGGGVQLL